MSWDGIVKIYPVLFLLVEVKIPQIPLIFPLYSIILYPYLYSIKHPHHTVDGCEILHQLVDGKHPVVLPL
jgi:hypothetical protein